MEKEYIIRINKAVEFINNNLHKNLNLSIVSQVSLYSPFYFHRLFTALNGETPNEFINRKKIEKSALELKQDVNISIIDIAIKYGYSSNSSYSKAFKKFYGVSPSNFKLSTNFHSKIDGNISKNGQKELLISSYVCNINNYKNWIKMNTKIEVKIMPKINIAYVTHVGAFDKIGFAYGKLMKWAGPKGLIGGKTITVYHDDPNTTEINKVRQSACIELKSPIKTDGEVNTTVIETGKYAVGKFEISFSEFEKSWKSMMIWVADNGFEVNAIRGCYEIYHNNFNNHPQKKCIIEICIPIN